MKRKIISIVVIATMLTPITEVLAFSGRKVIKLSSEKALAKEVFIEGLYDNSTMYIGGNTKISGYVDGGATNKNIQWQITGNSNGIIGFSSNGNIGNITAKSEGKVWIMARATDGSDMAREYTVNVGGYPTDAVNQSLIGNNIKPILKRNLNGGNTVLRVEVNSGLSTSNKRLSVENYLRKLSQQGILSNRNIYSDSIYEYYEIKVNSKNIEVRVEKSDSSYSTLKSILSDVSIYNDGGTEVKPPGEIEKPPIEDGNNIKPPVESGGSSDKKPEISDKDKSEISDNINEVYPSQENEEITLNPSKQDELIGKQQVICEPINTKENITLGVNNIINIGGTGESVEDSFIIMAKEDLSSIEKAEAIKNYIKTLSENRSMRFIKKEDTEEYISYIFKVSNKLSYVAQRLSTTIKESKNSNDFYIEIRVDKNDKEAYEPIIEMLDEIDGESNKVLGKSKEDELEEDNNEIKNEKGILIGLVTLLVTAIALKKYSIK